MVHTVQAPHNLHQEGQNLWKKYLAFCDRQEKYRFLWMVLAIMPIPCILMPISMYFSFQLGATSYLVIAYVFFLLANLVANLGELPARVSISVLGITVLFNLITPLVLLIA